MDILKIRWPLTVLISGEVIFLILFTLYRLDLIELKILVTLAVGEMIAGVLGYLLGRRSKDKDKEAESKSKQREKLECYIDEHNQRLINTVIKPWYEDKYVSNANKSLIIEHLKTGYADIWKILQEYKTLKDDLSSGEKAIKRYIKSKLNEGIPPNFEHDFSISNTGVLMADFTLEKVENLIYETVDNFSQNNGIPDNYKLHPQYFGSFGINILIDKSKTDLIKKSDVFTKLVETIIKDKNLYEKFETANKTKKLSCKKFNEFRQALKLIEHNFIERHVELNGTCKDCKDWHEELKFLK